MADDRETREERAAADEARRIGGDVNYENVDEAHRPLTESGEGVAEGYELAEEDHRRNAEHDDGEGNPIRDAYEVENEGDEQAHGEADHVHATGDPDDPTDAGEGDGTLAGEDEAREQHRG
jgi:hypothetical protein